jgi:regulator of sigma E protease
LPDSPAAKAGIVKDSAIQAVNGIAVRRPDDVLAFQRNQKEVTYTLLEGKDKKTRDVKVELKDGKAGIAISPFAAALSGPVRPLNKAVPMAFRETWFMTVQTVHGIANLVRTLATQGHVPEGITGIVGIAVLTYSSVQEGFMTYLRLVALLSLSLAILNVLPLPSLDGGRLLFVCAEVVMRRPLNQRFELVTNAIGFFLLIVLILIITFNDVVHLF